VKLPPVRDMVFDNTAFLQKMIGEQAPRQILSQLGEIEDAPPFKQPTYV
jgi:6-hydroxynicotinate 3-monooxygenase